MEDVLRQVAAGNLGNALTRLWVLAERSVDDAQTLGRWRAQWQKASHDKRVVEYVRLLQQPSPIPKDAMDRPLALIEALDTVHAERRPLPVVAKANPPALEIDGEHYRLLRRLPAPSGQRRPAEQCSPNLEGWFRHFRVVPEQIRIGGATINVKVDALSFVGGKPPPDPADLRFRVSHFADGATLRVDEDREGRRFFATGLESPELRERSMDAELECARGEEANLWLAPELTLTVELRRRLALSLAAHQAESLLICVPGTWHEMDGKHRVNRALVFNGNGQQVAQQEKCSQFSYPSGEDELAEQIDARRSVTLLVTPIGTVGIAICKDHFDATASGLIRACWDRLAPDWMLVPSMGDGKTVEAHLKRAKEAWEVRCTRSIVANQEARLASRDCDPVPGFIRCGAEPEAVKVGGSSFARAAQAGNPEPRRRGPAQITRIK